MLTLSHAPTPPPHRRRLTCGRLLRTAARSRAILRRLRARHGDTPALARALQSLAYDAQARLAISEATLARCASARANGGLR